MNLACAWSFFCQLWLLWFAAGPLAKSIRKEGHTHRSNSPSPASRGESLERERHSVRSKSGSRNPSPKHHGHHPSGVPPGSAPQSGVPPPPGQAGSQDASSAGFSQYNPYMSSQMFSSSFMSQEGSQNIRHLLGGGPPAGGAGSAPAPPSSYGFTAGAAANQGATYRPPATSAYPTAAGSSYTQPPPTAGAYSQQSTATAYQTSQTQYSQQGQYSQSQAQGSYGQYSSQSGYQASYPQPPPGYSQQSQTAAGGTYQAPSTAQPPPGYNPQQYGSVAQYSSPGSYATAANAVSTGTGGQYASQRVGYTTQQASTARAQYHSQQGNVPRPGYPAQQAPGYATPQGTYQGYQPPPPTAPMRPHAPGMRPHPRGGPPHQSSYPPRSGGPRGPAQAPPRHGQHNAANLTAVPIAGRPGGSGSRYAHH